MSDWLLSKKITIIFGFLMAMQEIESQVFGYLCNTIERKMSSKRKKLLTSIGFVWNVRQSFICHNIYIINSFLFSQMLRIYLLHQCLLLALFLSSHIAIIYLGRSSHYGPALMQCNVMDWIGNKQINNNIKSQTQFSYYSSS